MQHIFANPLLLLLLPLKSFLFKKKLETQKQSLQVALASGLLHVNSVIKVRIYSINLPVGRQPAVVVQKPAVVVQKPAVVVQKPAVVVQKPAVVVQ